MVTVGIDEVGRGCWAGPVVAGAVAMPNNFSLPADIGWRLDDSKKLSKANRTLADIRIRELAHAVGLGWVSASEVDEVGLTQAVRLAMQRALETVNQQIGNYYNDIIIDGSFNFLADNPKSQAVIKADGSVPAVSAASIVAKVARDVYMVEQSQAWPGYGFETHVGYGTRRHIEALAKLGPSVLHRRSYKPIQQYL